MISDADYAFLTGILRDHSGLAVGEGREYLMESRLRPVAVQLGHPTLEELVDRLRCRPEQEVIRLVCEAMATNETSFFRDGVPFELLRSRILPELIRRRAASRSIRIWCTAASFGQEPFSVAMLLEDFPLSDWNVEIIATDFSRPALCRARAGIFTPFEVQRGLSPEQRARFLVRAGVDWRIRDSTRRRVCFTELNLIHSFGQLGEFDLILCRNVLIYFDLRTKRDVLDRMALTLAPEGYLILGAAESAIGITDTFTRLGELPASVYQRSSVREAVGIAS
jgi:chemotaxis protein methyltransferase CheR